MKIIVISLSDAYERRRRMEAQLAALGLPFEFLDACDGRELLESDMGQIDLQFRRRWGLRPIVPAELACWRSHVQAIHLAAQNHDGGPTAIFEDDIIPLPALPGVLDALENYPDDFDLVNLGRRLPGRPLVAPRPLAAGRSMGRIRFSEYGAGGYVISNQAARYLTHRMRAMRLPVDMELMFFWFHRLDLYCLDAGVIDYAGEEELPSQISPARTAAASAKKGRLRRVAYRLQMGARKRLGWRRLISSAIRQIDD